MVVFAGHDYERGERFIETLWLTGRYGNAALRAKGKEIHQHMGDGVNIIVMQVQRAGYLSQDGPSKKGGGDWTKSLTSPQPPAKSRYCAGPQLTMLILHQ